MPSSFFVCAIAVLLTSAGPAGARDLQFNRDIRPILSENCYACHGPDKNTRKAKLRLDNAEGATADREGKAPVVPGKPEASELIRRITTIDADDIMPPPKTGKKLTPEQIALFREWIEQGAKYEGHWAYQPLNRPPAPGIQNASWPLNPIDNFILARLEREQLKPSAEAGRRVLLRRVSLDLTGLPPRPEEVDRYSQSTDPHWYESYVDGLLRSPHYGEQMAMHWLDLVRYADTVGFHGDNEFSAWPYRDYVINAFNENTPFDRFTREQIAGDLLPNATARTRVASGFNRLNRMSTEGGIQDKEYLAKYAADRVRTISATWLGATLGCAECHDHKFDPYTTKDFYSMEAFFADLNEKGFYPDGYGRGDWGPRLPLPSDDQIASLGAADKEVAQISSALAAITDDHLANSQERWARKVSGLEKSKRLGWKNVKPISAASSQEATLTIKDDKSVRVSGKLPEYDEYTVTLPMTNGVVAALRLESLTDDNLPGNHISRAGKTFYLSSVSVEVLRGKDKPAGPVSLASARADVSGLGYPAPSLLDNDPQTAWSPGGGPPGRRSVVLRLAEPIKGGKDVTLQVHLHHLASQPRQQLGAFRFSTSEFADDGFDDLGLPKNVIEAAKIPRAKRTVAQAATLASYYRQVAPELTSLTHRLALAAARRDRIAGQVPTMLVSEKRDSRTMRILPRGNWMDDSGEVVQPSVPKSLGAFKPAGEKANRLDLADWLVSRDNPVTARTFVNRLWRIYFGVGLSKNLDDLGSQGEWPTHPELLDWLAAEFRDSGWDIKHVIRLIVTSRTYRQTSTSNTTLDEHDPYNRLLGHQNRFRLDAEVVRDNALAISGLLANQIGGPSIRPYQPERYYAALNFPAREYVPSRDEDQYRRGVYVHWQRTFLHPSLLAFDAPGREECTANRVNSNTPLQALVLLNDPTYVEAARVFAERIMHRERDTAKRIEWAFQEALSRSPRPEEQKILAGLQAQQLSRYQKDSTAAKDLVQTGQSAPAGNLDTAELASWTAVTRAILNLHETITRN